MSNIIIEWLDFTWKTPITSEISKITNLKLVNKENITDIINGYYDINNYETTISNLNNIDNAIFDRHFMSLLVYWKLTNKSFYDAKIDEEKIFYDFLKNNENSVLLFRYSSHKRAINKILTRLDFREERISEHDLNLLDNKYFYDYSNTFHNLFDKFDEYNTRQWGDIITIKQSSANTCFNDTIDDILKLANLIPITENPESNIEKKEIIRLSDNYTLKENEILNKIANNEVLFNGIFKKCVDYVLDNNYAHFSKSKFVELNLHHSLNFYWKWLIISYWKEISIWLGKYIESHYKSEEDKNKLRECFLPLLMGGEEYSKYKNQIRNRNNLKKEVWNKENNLLEKHNLSSWIDGLELRFHNSQLIDNIDEILTYFKESSYEDWMLYYKSKKVKPTILKFLYLRRLKIEDYNKKTFSSLLLDLKYFEKYEFLYPLLNKYLEFWFEDEAINVLTHIHKMWWVWKEAIWLKNNYSDFFNLIWNTNLSNTDEFNWFLELLFNSKNYELAKSVYRKVPSKDIKENKKVEVLYKNEKTEEIYISNLDYTDLQYDFKSYWYEWSDRSFYSNTYLAIVEKFLEIWSVDYALKSINKFFSEWGEINKEFYEKNRNFVDNFCLLKLDFTDNKTLIIWLQKWLKNKNTYKYTLEVIKSMKLLTISIQHWIVTYLKDEDLLFLFNRTLWAKSIKWWWTELWEYALNFLKRFIKIWDKSRCTSCLNSAKALWVDIPEDIEKSYEDMLRIWNIKNTKFLWEFSELERLFEEWKYDEAKKRYINSEWWRTLWVGYYTIYIENINDEDFAIEKIKWLNLATKSEKFLNICLSKAFRLNISKLDQSIFFNTYIFIEDLLKWIEDKDYRLTEANSILYKDYIYKKNNNLLPILKKDNSKFSYSKKIMLAQNIIFNNEEIKFIDNLSKHTTWKNYWIIDNNEYEVHLQSKWIILKYLLLNNYDKWVEYFSWTSKSNELIFIYATYAEGKDIINKFNAILIFLLKEKNNLKQDVNKTFNDNQFWNIRKQDVYRVIKEKLGEENNQYLDKLRLWLEKIGFEDLDKEFTSTILYKINGYNFKQKHLDNIIEISKLDKNTNFIRNYLRENYNYLTYLANPHIRWEKIWIDWDNYSDALLQVSNILFNDWKINDNQLEQLKIFFENIKEDKTTWTRKIWLTLFEITNNNYDSSIDEIIAKWNFNNIELAWKDIKLSKRGVFLHYLFKTDYDKAISFFWWHLKTNQSIILFINFAKEKDINYYSENIINYFSKAKIDNQDLPYSKSKYKWYTKIRSDFVYNIMNEKLSNTYDWFLNKIKDLLTTKWFKNFNERKEKFSVNDKINTILNKFHSGDFWDIDKLLD